MADGVLSDRRLGLPLTWALGLTGLMWLAYTLIESLLTAEPAHTALSLLPGLVSLAALTSAGLPEALRYARFGRLSSGGLAALGLVTLLLLPILLSGQWVGWRPLPALVYGPASAVAQELFFRAALLAGLLMVFKRRRWLALNLHSLLFVAWHLGTFQQIPMLGPKMVVGAVLFLAGLGWGWQVQRDRTILWSTVQHGLFLAIMAMFEWS